MARMFTSPNSSIRLCSLWILAVISSTEISISCKFAISTPFSFNSSLTFSNCGSSSRLRALNASICSFTFSIFNIIIFFSLSSSKYCVFTASRSACISTSFSLSSAIFAFKISICAWRSTISALNLTFSCSYCSLSFPSFSISFVFVLIMSSLKTIVLLNQSI